MNAKGNIVMAAIAAALMCVASSPDPYGMMRNAIAEERTEDETEKVESDSEDTENSFWGLFKEAYAETKQTHWYVYLNGNGGNLKISETYSEDGNTFTHSYEDKSVSLYVPDGKKIGSVKDDLSVEPSWTDDSEVFVGWTEDGDTSGTLYTLDEILDEVADSNVYYTAQWKGSTATSTVSENASEEISTEKETEEAAEPSTEAEKSTSVQSETKTGDLSVVPYAASAVASMAGLTGAGVALKKKKK